MYANIKMSTTENHVIEKVQCGDIHQPRVVQEKHLCKAVKLTLKIGTSECNARKTYAKQQLM